ncbi:MAG: D-alanyl-D-alanine carboxypeptidase family protein [Anaerolineae bacterium]|nr:D-alanyl-D-alanine carboxypeptidase family protein [Anaerolineae bacterium]
MPISSNAAGRRILLASLLLLSLLNLGFGPPVLTSGGWPPLRLYPHQVRELAGLAQPPAVTAQAALLADARTGAVLFQRNAHQRLPPASTTKIMTALLALERGDLADMVTVPPAALTVGEASMGLVAGETLTLEELLYGLLLISANDAAQTIAIHIAGSVEGFVALMNARAAELGLTDTHFVNPHGLDAAQHFTSAADLLTLTRQVLGHADFGRIVATPEATVAGRVLVSTNELLGTYPGADGVKTGTTDAAGQCLIASARREEGQAIVILLGSGDRYGDAAALLDFYFQHYAWRALELPANRLSGFEDSAGQHWTLRLGEQSALFLPRWQWPLVQLFRWIDPEVRPGGSVIGVVRFTLGRHLLAELPLYAFVRE